MGKRELLLMILAVMYVSCIPNAKATEEKLPNISDTTIVGVWEAVYTGESTVRVFRMEVNEDGSGVLVQGLMNNVSFLSYLNHMSIKCNIIELTFKDVNHKPTNYTYKGVSYKTTGLIKIIGSGHACKKEYKGKSCDGGLMNVKLIIEPTHPDPRIWKLRFYNFGKSTLTNQIINMSEAVNDAIINKHSTFPYSD